MQEFSKEELELIDYLKANFKNRNEISKKLNSQKIIAGLRYNRPDILDVAFGKTNSVMWTLKLCQAKALKYKTKTEWKNGHNASYDAAVRNKWLYECCKHMISKITKWTLEMCKLDALKYKTKTEWKQKSSGAVKKAKQKGWYYECCKHMESKQKRFIPWTLDECKLEALKYNYKAEWQKSNSGSFNAAYKKGWLKKCCLHMKFKGKVFISNKISNINKTKVFEFIKTNKRVPNQISEKSMYNKYRSLCGKGRRTYDPAFKKQVDELLKGDK